jgi:hypothetical protein
MTDQERLSGYVDVWWQAVDDFTGLLEQLPAEEWSTPTDLAGWDVHGCHSDVVGAVDVLARGKVLVVGVVNCLFCGLLNLPVQGCFDGQTTLADKFLAELFLKL